MYISTIVCISGMFASNIPFTLLFTVLTTVCVLLYTTFMFTLLTLLTVLNCFTWIYYQNAIINKAKSHVQQAKDLYFDGSDIPALRAKANTTHVEIII